MKIRPILAIILLAILAEPYSSNAATITADSCSQAHVDAAVETASSGDTVYIPSGECTWLTSLTVPNNKKLILMGSGNTSTVLTKDPAGGGIIYLGQSGSRITEVGIVDGVITADGYDFRIDHCKLDFSSWTSGISIMSRNIFPAVIPTGVVDNNIISNMRVLVNGTNYMMTENEAQNGLWASEPNLGSAAAVYVENNVFTGGTNAIDGNYGGRYVFRYNTINGGTVIEAHSVQATNRSIQRWEIYGNIINNDGASVYYPFRIRGGTGIILYNSVTGNWTNDGIAFDNVRSFEAAGDGGLCDGDSDWDGNEDETGYPCRDQIGRGYDNPQWDDSPVGEYSQVLMPAYELINRTESNVELAVDVINSSSDHIKPNRDYYSYNAEFDGTAGSGCGTIGSRPATCTVGVGYWATSQSCSDLTGMIGANPTTPINGTLYKCTSTNTWTAYYTPYTYPHPLRGNAGHSLTTGGSSSITIGGGAHSIAW